MRIHRHLAALTAIALIASSATVSFAQSAKQYKVSVLGTLKGGSGYARALNISGEAVGSSGQPHGADLSAAHWSRFEHLTDLGRLPGGDQSEATAINDAGVAVGWSNTSRNMMGFVAQNGSLTELAPLSGDSSSRAQGINAQGVIAGASSGPKGMQAAIWNGSDVAGLGKLPGSQDSMATAINNNNEVVGTSNLKDGQHAFFWSAKTGMLDMGSLPGDRDTNPLSINDSGVVIGSSEGPNGTQAFIWTRAAGMKEIESLPNSNYSQATGINKQGVVVGTSGSLLGKRAFFWTPAGGTIDLNSVVQVKTNMVLTTAIAINDKGQILAIGAVDVDPTAHAVMDHKSHAGPQAIFLLTPIQ